MPEISKGFGIKDKKSFIKEEQRRIKKHKSMYHAADCQNYQN